MWQRRNLTSCVEKFHTFKIESIALLVLKSQDWLGVQCQKNTGFQIIPAPRSLSSTFEVEHFINCELESESEASWYGDGLEIHRL